MYSIKKLMLGVAFVSSMVVSATAAAIPFTITDAAFYPGPGYGDETTYRCGFLNLFICTTDTQLDANFSTGIFDDQSFSLNTIGAFKTFNFGKIRLDETNISGDEDDGLGITARLTFTDPLGVVADVLATGTVNYGNVDDFLLEKDDYFINWATTFVDFGTGGKFSIDLTDLTFNKNETITQTAKITLLALPSSPPANVPEPATLAMLSIGLIGIGAARRRKQQNLQ